MDDMEKSVTLGRGLEYGGCRNVLTITVDKGLILTILSDDLCILRSGDSHSFFAVTNELRCNIHEPRLISHAVKLLKSRHEIDMHFDQMTNCIS